MTRGRIVDLILIPVLCLAGSVMAGVLVYGGRVFDPAMAHFQFVVSGFIGGAFVLAVQARRERYTFMGGVAAFLMASVVIGSDEVHILARNAIWVIGLLMAVRGSLYIEDRLHQVAVGKFALWAAIFGIVHVCLFATLSFASRGSVGTELALFQGALGALIGAGVGLGHEVAELAKSRRVLRAHEGRLEM